jgi:hypothetical protein
VKHSTCRVRRTLVFIAGISAIFAVSPFAASAQTQAGRAAWTIQRTPNRSNDFNELTAITTTSASDAWAVGTFRGPSSTAYKTLIEHFDGTSWQVVPSPNVGASSNELNAVSADSSTDAWTAGFEFSGNANRTLIERWNGTKWSVVPSPNVGSGSNTLFGVAALSPTDAWAVGQSVGNVDATVALHWDGTSWNIVPSPNPPLVGGFFTAVAAIGSNDVWAVGRVGQDDATLAEHWDGQSWTIVSTPTILGEAIFSGAVAVASNDVWAVGDQGSQTLTEHWNGSAWTIVPSPNPLPTSKGNNFLTGVSALSSGDVWAVGATLDFTLGELEKTVTMRWDGAQWVVVGSPNQGRQSNVLQGVDSPGGGVVIAIGTFRTGSMGTNRTLAMENTQG